MLILLIGVCLLVFGFVVRTVIAVSYISGCSFLNIFSAISLAVGLVVVFGGGIVAIREHSTKNIKYEIQHFAYNYQETLDNYLMAKESHDGHQVVAARALIDCYNADVACYKEYSKNIWIDVWYPKQVANAIGYINKEEMEDE